MLYPRVSTNLQNNAFDWLKDEANNLEINLTIAFFEDFTPPTTQMPDCVIMRGYNQTISIYFEQLGVWVINTWNAMQLSLNKILTHQILCEHNIPNPPTIYHPTANYNFHNICNQLDDEKFIVKKIDGSKGENVFLVGSPSELSSAISKCQNNCLCQKFIAHSHGRDIRVWVIGDRIGGAVERFNENSFLSNFSQGGSARLIAIPPQVEKLALESTEALGLEFAGVDILYCPNNQYTVCEVNGNAGFRTISQFTHNLEHNIPHQLFAYIHNHYEQKNNKLGISNKKS